MVRTMYEAIASSRCTIHTIRAEAAWNGLIVASSQVCTQSWPKIPLYPSSSCQLRGPYTALKAKWLTSGGKYCKFIMIRRWMFPYKRQCICVTFSKIVQIRITADYRLSEPLYYPKLYIIQTSKLASLLSELLDNPNKIRVIQTTRRYTLFSSTVSINSLELRNSGTLHTWNFLKNWVKFS